MDVPPLRIFKRCFAAMRGGAALIGHRRISLGPSEPAPLYAPCSPYRVSDAHDTYRYSAGYLDYRAYRHWG